MDNTRNDIRAELGIDDILSRYRNWLLGVPGSPADDVDIAWAARDPGAARARLLLTVYRRRMEQRRLGSRYPGPFGF